MPLIRRIPKRGFNNARHATRYLPINLESLNRFRPKEYPVLKDPKGVLANESIFTDGVVLTPDGNPKPGETPQKLKGDEK